MKSSFLRPPFPNLVGWCALIAVGVTSCAGSKLPEYARPHGELMDPNEISGGDRIRYRELTPDDFRATEPPAEMREYAERMGAVTCAHVLSEPDPVYFIEQTEEGFRGAYRNLSFVAKMDRSCSWWNPKQGTVPDSYILQHEQIHFALSEVAARKLNSKAQKLIKNLQPTGNSQEEVAQVLNDTVRDLLAAAIEKLVDRNREFDEDTSNQFAPEVQQRWYKRVQAELKN